MTTKGGLQRRQHRQTLFAQGGQITTNARKGLGTSNATEAPGDLLLHFDHAKISLGQIVIKIHSKILQEGQDSLLTFAQPIKQIASSTLFVSPACSRRRNRMRMKPISFSEQFQEACFPSDDFQRVQPELSLLTRLFGGLLHIQEQLLQVCGPHRSLFFCQKHQVAQQMHHAHSVLAVVQEVRSPSVVDRDPGELRQNPDRFQCRLTSALIHVIVGEGRRAGHVHPVPFACHIQSCLILMDHIAVDQGCFDLLLHGGQLSRTAFDQLPDRPLTHLDEEQVSHHLTGTSQWQQLLFDQIHRRRSYIGSILDGGLHSGGKCGVGDLLALGTLFLLRLVFPYPQTRRRHIHHLSTLSSTRCHRLQVVLTRFTSVYLQLGDLIWGGRELQAGSRVSWLPARFLLALCAQAFRLASKTIRGRRQVAIVAIFREPVPQIFHLLAQAAHLLTVVLEQGVLLRQPRLLLLDEFVSLRQLFPQTLILFSQRNQFFFNRHALTLLGLTPFGKSPADLGSYIEPSFSKTKEAPIIIYRMDLLWSFSDTSAHMQCPEHAFGGVAHQRGCVLHRVCQCYGTRRKDCHGIDAKRIYGLVVVAQAASQRQDGKTVTLCNCCYGSNALAVSGLAIELSLGCYDQVRRAHSFFKSHCFQYDLRAGTQRCSKESDKTRAQATSGACSGYITYRAPEVAFDDLRVMSERLVQLYDHLRGCAFLRAIDCRGSHGATQGVVDVASDFEGACMQTWIHGCS